MEETVRKAFETIKRSDFLPEDVRGFSSLDEPLPIGFDQTNSQPFTVGFMLDLLDPQPDQKILDIGSGSGWTSSLLASIVGPLGKVIALETIKELKEFGEKNADKYDFVKKGIISFHKKNGRKGFSKEAPFDRILVSASLAKEEIPKAWERQLKVNGRLVCPISGAICLFVKVGRGDLIKTEYPGFTFVPLVK